MHRQTQHSMDKGGLGKEGDGEGGGEEPMTFRMVFLAKTGPRPFPVEGCSVRAATRTAIRMKFWHRHVQYTVVILEEGNLPHPWCPMCNMLDPWRSLNGLHQRTAECKKGEERKRRRLTAEEERAVTSRAFSTYGPPLEIVTYFRYLGRVILGADENCPLVVWNLVKVRAVWRRTTRILSREG